VASASVGATVSLTRAECAAQIRVLITILADAGHLLTFNTVREGLERVSWADRSTSQSGFITDQNSVLSVQDYLYWLENGMYTAVLSDCSLLQLTYNFKGTKLAAHRLAFIPCPYDVPEELSAELPLIEAVELARTGPLTKHHLRGAIRFDFDASAAAPGHPASHVTLNSTSCRVPCYAPLSVGRFGAFLLDHLLGEEGDSTLLNGRLSLKEVAGSATISPDEEKGIHVRWAAVY
jgi:hypothetical protein